MLWFRHARRDGDRLNLTYLDWSNGCTRVQFDVDATWAAKDASYHDLDNLAAAIAANPETQHPHLKGAPHVNHA